MHVCYFNHESVWIIPLSLICYNPPTVCVCVCPNIYFLFTIRLFPVAAGAFFVAFSAKCFCSVHHQVRSLKLTCTTCLVVYVFSLQTSQTSCHTQGWFSSFLVSARTSFYCFKHLKLLLLVSDTVRLFPHCYSRLSLCFLLTLNTSELPASGSTRDFSFLIECF